MAGNLNFTEIWTPQGLQKCLNTGERPTIVLHFDMKTNSYRATLPKMTRLVNATKKAYFGQKMIHLHIHTYMLTIS